MNELRGKRLLAVGASVSIGAATVRLAAERGARVVAVARRRNLLDGLAESTSGEVHPLVADVTKPGDCDRIVECASETLGGLDWVLYTPALFLLRELEEMTAEEWASVFALNVTAAAMITRAAVPALSTSRGRIGYFASVSTNAEPHWPGLAAYAVTKTALAKMIRCWRIERPEIGFSMFTVGDTEGTDGPNQAGWTPEQVARFMPEWRAAGRLSPKLQPVEVVAHGVLSSFASRSYMEEVSIVPPRAI